MSTSRRFRPPPMRTLEAFDVSVRAGSFSKAAEILNLTAGAVSRQMSTLEGDLQVVLFDRHARGISPTAAGKRLHRAVQDALHLVLAAARDIRDGGRASADVRISVAPSFGSRWFIPRLPGFRLAHPTVCPIPVADNRQVDLDTEQFDLAVRYTDRPDGALQSLLMMTEELCVIAAPSLAADSRPVLETLAGTPFLHDRTDEGWRTWLSNFGHPELLPDKGVIFNDYNLMMEATAAGLGVAIGRTALIAEDLHKRRICEISPVRVPSPRSYYLIRPRRPPSPAAQLVWDWLIREGRSQQLCTGQLKHVDCDAGQADIGCLQQFERAI